MKPSLDTLVKRAADLECRYIERHERERYEALGWTVTDNLGHHAAHALLATRRGNDTVSGE